MKLKLAQNTFKYVTIFVMVVWGGGILTLLASLATSCTQIYNVRVEDPTKEDHPKIFRSVTKSAVKLEVESENMAGSGSGTIIWSSPVAQLVVTCDHVVYNEMEGKVHDSIIVIGPHGDRFPGLVEKRDAKSDLALLVVYTVLNGTQPLPIATEDPQPGDKVLIVASPVGYDHTLAEGVFSSKLDLPSLGPVWQVTSFIFPGSSGGTVTNAKGEFIAVPRAISVNGGFPISQIGFCVPLPLIKNFLDGYFINGKAVK